MIISTRGRYALRVLIDLAEHTGDGYIPMKEVAARQDISLKYLEQIIPTLSKSGFVEGVHGKGGGYRLIKPPEDCRVGDILRITEGDLAPVSCLEKGHAPCKRVAECRTYPMWAQFHKLVNDYFDSITLADLMKTDLSDNYSI